MTDRIRRRSALALIGQLPLLLALGCRKNRGAGLSSSQLKLGIAIASHVHALAWIAKDKGFFGREGFDCEVEVMGGSAAAIRTLVAGKIDVALAGGDAALKASWAGAELSVVASLVDHFYHRVIAKSGVHELGDLRGRKLGVPFLGGPQEMAARYALGKAGLEPGRDVELIVLGTEINLVGALERGEIDATTSDLPKSRLERMQLRVLADLPLDPKPFPYLVVVAQRSLAKPNVKRVLRALCAATRYYRDPANREASVAVIESHIPGGDVNSLLEYQREAGAGLLQPSPLPSREAFETVIELAGKGEPERKRLDELLELGSVRELVAEGGCGSGR